MYIWIQVSSFNWYGRGRKMSCISIKNCFGMNIKHCYLQFMWFSVLFISFADFYFVLKFAGYHIVGLILLLAYFYVCIHTQDLKPLWLYAGVGTVTIIRLKSRTLPQMDVNIRRCQSRTDMGLALDSWLLNLLQFFIWPWC